MITDHLSHLTIENDELFIRAFSLMSSYFLVAGEMPQQQSSQDKHKFYMRYINFFTLIPTYFSIVLIKLLGVVCLMTRFRVSQSSVIQRHVGSIFPLERQLPKVLYYGINCLTMFRDTSNIIDDAKHAINWEH